MREKCLALYHPRINHDHGAIQSVFDTLTSSKSKHIHERYHSTGNVIKKGIIRLLVHIKLRSQVVDIPLPLILMEV